MSSSVAARLTRRRRRQRCYAASCLHTAHHGTQEKESGGSTTTTTTTARSDDQQAEAIEVAPSLEFLQAAGGEDPMLRLLEQIQSLLVIESRPGNIFFSSAGSFFSRVRLSYSI